MAVARVNPGLLEGMITDRGDGTYAVSLFELRHEGLWNVLHGIGFDVPATPHVREVVVDADLPVYDHGGAAFARPGRDREAGELWPALAEKAYAKLKGSYEDIGEGGDASFALTSLTGNRTRGYGTHRSAAELDRVLRAAIAARQPVVLSSRGGRTLPHGLVAGHAYALLGRDAQGRYRLYNPWGRRHPAPMTAAQIRQAFSKVHVGTL